MPALHHTVPPRRWTAEEVRALMDETRPTPRYELIDGELLVTPSPRRIHQRAVGLLVIALSPYVDAQRLGELLISPADLELEPGTVTQPDLFVVPAGDEPAGAGWADIRALLLAIEVLSPSSARHDRVTKRHFFARVRVPEYWIVDVDARVFERWRPGDERAELLDERLEWWPDGSSEAFTLELPAFFARVHREA